MGTNDKLKNEIVLLNPPLLSNDDQPIDENVTDKTIIMLMVDV